MAARLVPYFLPDRAAPVHDLSRGGLRRRWLVGTRARDEERHDGIAVRRLAGVGAFAWDVAVREGAPLPSSAAETREMLLVAASGD